MSSVIEDSVSAVQQLVSEIKTHFELVPFHNYNAVAKLKSQYYNGYFVAFHVNTLLSAGWLVWIHAMNGGCPSDKAI